jgi:hypothetical protein
MFSVDYETQCDIFCSLYKKLFCKHIKNVDK